MANFTRADFRRAIKKHLGKIADRWDAWFKARGIPKRKQKHDPAKDPNNWKLWNCPDCGTDHNGYRPTCRKCRKKRRAKHGKR